MTNADRVVIIARVSQACVTVSRKGKLVNRKEAGLALTRRMYSASHRQLAFRTW
jgi:hypothetical protein